MPNNCTFILYLLSKEAKNIKIDVFSTGNKHHIEVYVFFFSLTVFKSLMYAHKIL